MSISRGKLPDPDVARAAEARIRDRVYETPLLPAFDLEPVVGQRLFLKAENLQCTGSFKARGALNWVRTASAAELSAGLVTVSAGNHALALAWATADSNTPVTVVMPEGSSPYKIEASRKWGAAVGLAAFLEASIAPDHCRDTVLIITGGNMDLEQLCGF